MTKEIATKKENKNDLLFSVDESALNQMSQDSKNHIDDTNPDDISIPRLRILQSTSDQVKKSTPEYIKGAEEGDLFNTLSKTVYKAEDGILFTPAKRRVVYLEWKEASGGGLVKNYGEDATAFLEASIDDFGKRISKTGNEIVKTHDVFGFAIDMKNKSASEVVISMSKTQAKKAKQWNAMIRQLADKATGVQLPEFAGVYKLTTIADSNHKGSWFNYNIEFAGYTLGIPEIGQIVYGKAKAFAKLISENSVKTASYENEVSIVNNDDRI